MIIKQISVLIENKPGTLAELTRFLADKGVNLRALSIADTQDFGILRLICEDPDEVHEALKADGYIVSMTDVLAVELADRPGSLAAVLELLAKAGVMVEYTYAFLTTRVGAAFMIFRVDDNAKAEQTLTKAGIRLANMRDLF